MSGGAGVGGARLVRPWRAILLTGLLILAGCAGMLPGQGPAPTLYTPSPKSTFSAGLPEVRSQLVVEKPIAAGGLETFRIALKSNPLEFEYFADVRFTEIAPELVQTLLIESFENTERIVAVGRQAIGLRSDYNLKTELREFQAEYFDGARIPNIRVRINAKVVKQTQRTIIASRTFESRIRAADSSFPSVIAAFDEALGKVTKGVVEWTLTTME